MAEMYQRRLGKRTLPLDGSQVAHKTRDIFQAFNEVAVNVEAKGAPAVFLEGLEIAYGLGPFEWSKGILLSRDLSQ